MPPKLGLVCVPSTGTPASLCGYGTLYGYVTLCPYNGGSSGSGYSAIGLSPCGSETHSALLFGQGSHRIPALCAVSAKRTCSLHSLFSLQFYVVISELSAQVNNFESELETTMAKLAKHPLRSMTIRQNPTGSSSPLCRTAAALAVSSRYWTFSTVISLPGIKMDSLSGFWPLK